jgi:hypothetical protein
MFSIKTHGGFSRRFVKQYRRECFSPVQELKPYEIVILKHSSGKALSIDNTGKGIMLTDYNDQDFLQYCQIDGGEIRFTVSNFPYLSIQDNGDIVLSQINTNFYFFGLDDTISSNDKYLMYNGTNVIAGNEPQKWESVVVNNLIEFAAVSPEEYAKQLNECKNKWCLLV